MKPYLTRFHNLGDAVCNVDYLCHRGCSMSLTLHESCSITLALRSLGFPGRRGIHFVFFLSPPAPRPRRPALPRLALHSQQSSPLNRRDFLYCSDRQALAHHPGVSAGLPATVQLPAREGAEVRRLVKKAAWRPSRWSRDE